MKPSEDQGLVTPSALIDGSAQGESRWLALSNLNCFWGRVWGLGAFGEIEQWYSPERDDYRWCLSFKISVVGLLVTGNIYLGPAKPNV